jgi:hypothetical protein
VHSCVRQPLWWNKNVPRPTLIEALDLLDLVVARSSTFAFGGAKSKIQATRSRGSLVPVQSYGCTSTLYLYLYYMCHTAVPVLVQLLQPYMLQRGIPYYRYYRTYSLQLQNLLS